MSNAPEGGSSKALIAAAAVLFVLVGGWFFVVSPMLNSPQTADDWNVQTSSNGLYTVTATPSLDPISLNETHDWTIHIENSAGQIVENATISVSGNMPAHGHGLENQPQFTGYLGNGDYRVEGMFFQMPGEWEVNLVISDESNTESDTVQFSFSVSQ